MKNITVRYFAAIREAVDRESENLQTAAATLADVRDELIARGGPWAQALARSNAVRTALNHVMHDEATALPDGAEVAFFPPVTGG